MKSFKLLAIATVVIAVTACSEQQQKQTNESAQNNNALEAIWPKLDIKVKKDPAIEARVAEILSGMTLQQKVAQMIQPEIRDITSEDMRQYGFGSYLNGGGAFPNDNKHATPADWIALAESMYQASIDDSLDGSNIPTMWGTDAVHGHNNVIGATLFPHNIGLGAANNPELIEKIANITATEVMVTGIDWVFAPTVATVRDDRWGRTYESYSEDPRIVREYSAAIVKGLQGDPSEDFLGNDRVISTVKHFIGDGGTIDGDDQGNNVESEQALFDIHGQGYVGGLTAGAQSVMASFNSWHGKKLHGSKYLLTDVLKNRMGFDGFVVGDWNGHGQIQGCSNDNCAQAANAGLDIYMVPTAAWKPLYENIIAQVKAGTIAQSRIDDAVTRILRVKLRAGLFEKPSPANRVFSGKTELIGQASHREVAAQAVRESLVLLKNKNNILPIDPTQRVLIAGDAANNIGKQSGGWTITWQGTNNSNDDFPGASSIYQGIAEQVKAAGGSVELSEQGDFTEKPDLAVVVFGEEPYAEGHGDRDNLDYQRGLKTDLALLNKLKRQGIPVVSVFISGRPMWVNQELNASDAFVAAWLPGSEGEAVADVLLSDADGNVQQDFTGKLSFSWPNSPYQTTVNYKDSDYQPLLAYGFGLNYQSENVLGDDLSETYQAPASEQTSKLIFNGKVHKPWTFSIFSGEQNTVVTASTLAMKGVRFRTIDRLVQEDAFSIDIDSNVPSGIVMASQGGFREDLSSVFENEFVLSFLVNVEQSPSDEVSVSMSCNDAESAPAGKCEGTVNITETLKQMPKRQWQTIAIAPQCFADQGVLFGNLTTAFKLTTVGQVKLGITNIEFTKQAPDAAVIQCK